ncbi:alpha/beta-Hydrolases superfamily protein [Rhynchospora pubera]|uniref:Alpha/beta-Hydrolases superfamily protein n=1 Tax=Rhynchospora pubera TaxID=906938 RepID=A0AAV8C084_9POAL|nr:alpha/beta-Hydrolases superfamily protein [Rhynchospora pubera]
MGLALPLATAALMLAWVPHVVTCARSSSHVLPRCLSNSSSHILVSYKVDPSSSSSSKKMADCSDDFRTNFLRVLQSRRKILEVPPTVEHGNPIADPLYQNKKPLPSKMAMETCPRKEIEGLQEKLVEENLYLITEEGEQGRLPVLILSLKDDAHKRKPAIVFLHSSYMCKEWLRPLLEAYASRGYVSIAIDSRYHGERAHTNTTYVDALVSAWRMGDTMPFIFDTVWDLIKLADYLVERDDIDPAQIGITGESLGGMHAWFAAAADARYSVAVPIIGIQLQGLILGRVWDRIAPGLDSEFDSPYSVPAIAPRPLLVLNGADDPRCPLSGLKTPEERTSTAYKSFGSADKFKLIAEPGIGHQMTSSMVKEASDWFDRFL